eukprot:46039-Prorocentrum_minimum.AAC.1
MTLSSTKHTGQAASCLNAREVNQPPQPPSPLIVGTCPGLSLYPFWDEGLAGKALSARPTSLRLDPTSLWRRNHPSGIPTPSGIPPEFVKRAYAADCVLVRVQVAVWLGIVWVPPSGVRHSQATADRLTDRGLALSPPAPPPWPGRTVARRDPPCSQAQGGGYRRSAAAAAAADVDAAAAAAAADVGGRTGG